MGDFSQIEDFLNDDSFINWVLSGTEDSHWELFITTYPEKINLLLQAKEIVRTLYAAEDISFPADSAKTWSRIQQTLHSDPPFTTISSKFSTILRKNLMRSMILLLMLTGTIWYFSNQKTDSYTRILSERAAGFSLLEKVNNSPAPMELFLPDSSIVTLQRHSKLSYPPQFDSLNREVYLTGEAFFKVKKDRKPFYVYAGDLVTKVLGTSFNIKAIEGDPEVVVNVQSGSVSVSAKEQKSYGPRLKAQSTILLPNQEVTYNRSAASLNKTISATPSLVFPSSESLLKEYEEVPVTHLLNTLAQIYGINILFNEENLASCIITTNLTNQTLFESLEIICSTIGSTFNIIDAQIVIDSTGCSPTE